MLRTTSMSTYLMATVNEEAVAKRMAGKVRRLVHNKEKNYSPIDYRQRLRRCTRVRACARERARHGVSARPRVVLAAFPHPALLQHSTRPANASASANVDDVASRHPLRPAFHDVDDDIAVCTSRPLTTATVIPSKAASVPHAARRRSTWERLWFVRAVWGRGGGLTGASEGDETRQRWVRARRIRGQGESWVRFCAGVERGGSVYFWTGCAHSVSLAIECVGSHSAKRIRGRCKISRGARVGAQGKLTARRARPACSRCGHLTSSHADLELKILGRGSRRATPIHSNGAISLRGGTLTDTQRHPRMHRRRRVLRANVSRRELDVEELGIVAQRHDDAR